MSDHRRLSSRASTIKQRQIPSDSVPSVSTQIPSEAKKTAWKTTTSTISTSTTTSSSRNRKSPNVQNTSPSETSNKRSRVDSLPSRKFQQKKRKEIIYDNSDEDDVEEIFSAGASTEKTDRCAICLDDCTEPKQLNKCSHVFCKACIDQYFETVKPQCPCCLTIYGEIRGNQPINGTMVVDKSKHRLPGFEHDSRGTIRIAYHFPNGIQDESQPNPGTPYYGTTRQAYLPDNREGRHVLELLEKAFHLRQIFTVGQSRTTGYDNVITWNDIHHKTSIMGGVESFGYPDKTYLNRVKQELAAKGIL